MRIVIFGAGAIGGLFGAHLARHHGVTLLCREKHALAVEQNGLRITGLSDIHVQPGAATAIDGLGQPDLLILTVKAYDTELAAKDVIPLIGQRTKVLSLQNGLGNLEMIAGIIGRPAIGGVTSHGAILHEPGIIEHTGKSYTIVGDQDIARLFTEAGIETRYSDDIQAEIWYKAIVNCVINPIGTLMRDRNGLLVRDKRFEPLARQIVSEGVEVAKARGIDLDFEQAWHKTIRVATETAENICSMRKDAEAGRRTEIGQMNGAIARYALELGVRAPANALLAALVKGLQGQHL